MKTKPKGIWATFVFDCPHCLTEQTVTNGRVDHHDCRPDYAVTLAQIRAALGR